MFGFLGQTTEDGNRCLDSLRESYTSAKKALEGKPALYQKHQTTMFSVMLAINSVVALKNQIGAGSVAANIPEFNRQACDALVRYGGTLEAIRVEAGLAAPSIVTVLPKPSTPVSTTVAVEEAVTRPSIPSVLEAGESFDPVAYEREMAEYRRQVTASTNTAGEITTPRPGREPVWLTPSNVSGVVNAIFGGVAQFQKAQIEAELLRLSAMGKPAQLPTGTEEKFTGQKKFPWWGYALAGAGLLLFGGIVYAGVRGGRKKREIGIAPSIMPSSPPKMLMGPSPMKLLPAPK